MCQCQRDTYLCQCGHKERTFIRCPIYQLQKEASCWSWCLPKCRPRVRRYEMRRVCTDCEEYFYRRYGELQYKKFIQLFLVYKESKGWGRRTVIDPRTVPREALLNRQSAPARMNWEEGQEGPRDGPRGQPFPVHPPMAPIAEVADPAVDMQSARPVSRPGTPFPRESTPSPDNAPAGFGRSPSPKSRFAATVSDVDKDGNEMPPYVPQKEKPFCADPGIFTIGDDEDDSDDDYSGGDEYSNRRNNNDNNNNNNNNNNESNGKGEELAKQRVYTPSPAPKYHTKNLPAGLGIVPELAYLAAGREGKIPAHRISQPEIQQPKPSAGKKRADPGVRNADSNNSLVRRLTEAAADIEIPNIDYYEYEGKYVPRIITPPPGKRRTRSSTPSTGSGSSAASARSSTDHDSKGASARSSTSSISGEVNIGIALAADATPDSSIVAEEVAEEQQRGGEGEGKGKGKASTYYVRAHRDSVSPTGASVVHVRGSPSHSSVAMPPPRRLDGVLIPPGSANPQVSDPSSPGAQSPGEYYEERGVPSPEDRRRGAAASAAQPGSPGGVVVAVHTPKRRYSCAVQACYCDVGADGERVGDKCPSCKEREAITEELHTTWI
ncbi:hypothetical protein F4802DRAFT_612813 [Xylaria palmicola]|nr:hypothetical protein F4802DRAFT_612813 [Xylaria palmicola]